MKQIFLASSFFQIATIVAAIDSGDYDKAVTPASTLEGPGAPDSRFEKPNERVLLTSTASLVLESAPRLSELPELTPLLDRFDRVEEITDLISPFHPHSWSPREIELPIWERMLRDRLHLEDDSVELVLESPQANPAMALARIFHDAHLRVHSDGLMTYSPTRKFLPLTMGQRVTSLHYLPLVEKTSPRLLSEFEITPYPISREAFTKIVELVKEGSSFELPSQLKSVDRNTTAIAFGQYLASLELISEDEEHELHKSFISEAKKRNLSTVIFKPHPASPPDWVASLKEFAQKNGMNLIVYSSPIIAEVLVSEIKPALTIGCFSTALATSRAIYNIPSLAVGTEMLLDRLTPYQNSNRIPVTISDALFDGSPTALTNERATEVQMLFDTVAYAMQPKVAAHLRPVALDFLSKRSAPATMKYFKKKRLTALDLPGGLPKRYRPRTVLRRSFVEGQKFALEGARAFLQKRRAQKALDSE